MRTRLTLRPGQHGTRKMQLKYGGRLIAVRYRYDEARRLRFKTVELIEEQLPWDPPMPPGQNPEELVFVRVDYHEVTMRQALWSAGGRWDKDRKLWRARYAIVYGLGLQRRIVR